MLDVMDFIMYFLQKSAYKKFQICYFMSLKLIKTTQNA